MGPGKKITTTNFLLVAIINILVALISLGVGAFMNTAFVVGDSWTGVFLIWGLFIFFVAYFEWSHSGRNILISFIFSVCEVFVLILPCYVTHAAFPEKPVMLFSAVLAIYTTTRMIYGRHPFFQVEEKVVYTDHQVLRVLQRKEGLPGSEAAILEEIKRLSGQSAGSAEENEAVRKKFFEEFYSKLRTNSYIYNGKLITSQEELWEATMEEARKEQEAVSGNWQIDQPREPEAGESKSIEGLNPEPNVLKE
jgi:hypothetical protein